MPLLPKLIRPGVILVFIINLFQFATAQNFTIRHDLVKDSTQYYKFEKANDSTGVSEISYKKPGFINLRVQNFNPFYWDAKVTVYKRPVDEEAGHIGMFISGLTKSLGVSGFPSLSRGEGDAQVQKRLTLLYYKLEESGMQLNELKYDALKTEAEIKAEAKAIGNDIMNLLGKNKLDKKELKLKGKELDDSLDASMETPFTEMLPLLGKIYNEIIYTDYKFYYNIKGNPDINLVKLQVYPKSDSLAGENKQDTITKYFQVHDKAALKLLSSVGITFTFFRDNNRSYFITPDMKIGQGTGDIFTPVISSFIHFYGNMKGGFKPGGVFGFGIPLTGERKDINFMFGVSAMLGRKETVIISAGVAGTKVQRLASNLKVGQSVPNASYIIATTYQYRPGGFFSLSFNLKSFSSNK